MFLSFLTLSFLVVINFNKSFRLIVISPGTSIDFSKEPRCNIMLKLDYLLYKNKVNDFTLSK